QQRANKASGDRIEGTGLIGGPFTVTPNPAFITERLAIFDTLWQAHEAHIAALPEQAITVTLPSGEGRPGVAYKTTPYDIAKSIAQGLADSVVIARVVYTKRLEEDVAVACDEDEEAGMSLFS
ncbi:TGS domain-containing protein, partial [archaeon]